MDVCRKLAVRLVPFLQSKSVIVGFGSITEIRTAFARSLSGQMLILLCELVLGL